LNFLFFGQLREAELAFLWIFEL